MYPISLFLLLSLIVSPVWAGQDDALDDVQTDGAEWFERDVQVSREIAQTKQEIELMRLRAQQQQIINSQRTPVVSNNPVIAKKIEAEADSEKDEKPAKSSAPKEVFVDSIDTDDPIREMTISLIWPDKTSPANSEATIRYRNGLIPVTIGSELDGGWVVKTIASRVCADRDSLSYCIPMPRKNNTGVNAIPVGASFAPLPISGQ